MFVLARLPRPAAILTAVLLVLASIWCFAAKPPPIHIARKGGYTDIRLYYDIAAAVKAGQPYHAAAAALQRAHQYPLRPFVTMRLPTLTEIGAHIGWPNVQIIAFVVGFVAIMLWVVATEGKLHWIERGLVALTVGGGATMAVSQVLMPLHEYWDGLAIAIALAGVVGWPRRWWAIALPIACGLAIRELALPFALLALVFAGFERRGKEVAGWLVIILGFLVFMAIHAWLAQQQWHNGDLVSTGWHGMQGPAGFLKAVIYTSSLQSFPRPLAMLLAMLPLFGWMALDGREGRFCCLLWLGYAVMIGAFSRPDTFYWGAIVLPAYFAGLALLPRALWQLAGAIRQRPLPVPNISPPRFITRLIGA